MATDLDATAVSYADFVSRLCKAGGDIVDQMTPEKAHLWHMATGVAGEGGELLDAFKRHCVYGKDLDIGNVIEELGDLRFFMTEIQTRLGITDAEVEGFNRAKLAERYAKLTYSDAEAHARADKA